MSETHKDMYVVITTSGDRGIGTVCGPFDDGDAAVAYGLEKFGRTGWTYKGVRNP